MYIHPRGTTTRAPELAALTTSLALVQSASIQSRVVVVVEIVVVGKYTNSQLPPQIVIPTPQTDPNSAQDHFSIMLHLLCTRIALLTAIGLATAGQPNSQSNPWRIRDDQPGGTNVFAEYYPIDNGRLGIMVSGDPRTEQIRLNENSFWSGSLLHRVNPDALTTVRNMR